MNQDLFRRAKDIFQEALEGPATSRPAFVSTACAGDAELEREVDSLLRAAIDSGGRLEAARLPPISIADLSISSSGALGATPERARVGAWRIVREIGRGGMGSVYLAERSDDVYQGRAALKLVKRGMDTDFILQRFRAERQILASLNHPNITRLLEGGTTEDGHPYFVMEFIEGESLTGYCESRHLSLRGRIELFRTVCEAVQFAHRSLVVHRDIKPSNVIVTADGTVKLLDFGLAKDLDFPRAGESGCEKVQSVAIFTPDYASPEQVKGERITTATDVYSLGVVLYELLAGKHPYRAPAGSPADLLNAVRETDPPPPSAAVRRLGTAGQVLSRGLAGDLDTIVMKAMQKEPERRYASVEQLSDDLRRHLDGEPVSARADTLVYRAGKFVRRNRVSVAAAAVVLLSLSAALGAALWEARVARRRFDDVRALANSLRVGGVQGNPFEGNTGDTEGATRSYREAARLLEGLLSGKGAEPGDRRLLADTYGLLGEALLASGDVGEALSYGQKSVEIHARLAGTPGAAPAARYDLALSKLSLAYALSAAAFDGEALSATREGTRILEGICGSSPENVECRRRLGRGWFQIAWFQQRFDRPRAFESYSRALAILEPLAAAHPGNGRLRRDVAWTHNDLAQAAEAAGDAPGAARSLERSVAIFEELSAADPSNRMALLDRATALSNLGALLGRTGHEAGARERLRQAVSLAEPVVLEDPYNAWAGVTLAQAYFRMGKVVRDAPGGPPKAARPWFEKAHEAFQNLRARGKLSPHFAPEAEAAAREWAAGSG